MLVAYFLLLVHFMSASLANPVDIASIGGKPDVLNNADTSQNCPVGYSQPANSNWPTCYKIINNFKNKKSAAAQCKANNGTLAAVPNSFVNSYLYYIANQIGATSFWLGIECFNGDANTCVNDDGTPFVYSNFYPGQPNVDGNCVYMSTIGRDAQQWLSFGCEQKFQFACEAAIGVAPPVVATTISTSTTSRKTSCPDNYSFYMNMCYKGMCYLKNDVPFRDTRDQESINCQTVSGGNLATIPNSDVDSFIQNMPCNNLNLRIGLKCYNVQFDGDTSSCVWDDGQPFVYNNFASGYPKANPQNPCIYELYGQWLNDAAKGCNVAFSCSICQAPPQ